MNRITGMIFVAVALLLLSPAATGEECFEIDADRSSASFEVKQAGIPVRGEFGRFGGRLCFADGDAVHLVGWVETFSVHTGFAEADAAVKSEDVLDVENHPRATFASREIETTADGFIARGVLELKGVRREIEIPFNLEKTPDGYRVEGATILDRFDFNVGTREWPDTTSLSDEVKVELSFVAQ